MQEFFCFYSSGRTVAPLKTFSTRMFEMLDEDIFHFGRSASKVLHNCDNHSNLCVQQHGDNHNDLSL